MHTAYLISVWLHILAAMTWIGGMLFLVMVLVPMLRQPDMRDQAMTLFHTIGLRFRRVGWSALLTLIATGVFNILNRGYSLGQIFDGEAFAGAWGHTLAWKLAFVAVIVTSSIAHDFYVGPMATRLAKEGAPQATRDRLRRVASWMGRSTLLLALAVVALAVMLVRGTP